MRRSRSTRRASLACLSSVIGCLSSAADAATGMPQLDFANPLTLSQLVWLVIIFAVLYLLLSSWALPKVGAVLSDRATRIADDLDTARAAKTQADQAAGDIRAASRRAHDQAHVAITTAVTEAKQNAEAEAARLNAGLEARLAAAEAAIAQARQAAMASLAEVASEVAASMIERLTGRPAPPGAVQRAIADQRAQTPA